MTATARAFDDSMIKLRNLNCVGIEAGCEIEGMPEAVVRLHGILPCQIMGCVTVIADRSRVMARFHPRIVLRLHHMAISAGRRIVGEIGISLRIQEGVAADSERRANQQRKQNSYRAIHPGSLLNYRDREM